MHRNLSPMKRIRIVRVFAIVCKKVTVIDGDLKGPKELRTLKEEFYYGKKVVAGQGNISDLSKEFSRQ